MNNKYISDKELTVLKALYDKKEPPKIKSSSLSRMIQKNWVQLKGKKLTITNWGKFIVHCEEINEKN